MGNFVKEAIQEMKESWKVPELLESVAEGLQASFGQLCVKETIQEMKEFWKVPELLESVAGGLQASFGQFCKGNYTGSEKVLEGA